jgi:hypothetical protein
MTFENKENKDAKHNKQGSFEGNDKEEAVE